MTKRPVTAVDELIAFVRAALDEDYEAAQVAAALTRSPWMSEGPTVVCGDGFPVVSHGDGEPATAQHIARWDPARALAEVEAKRQILDEYERVREGVRNPVSAENRAALRIVQGTLEDVIRWHAQPYAGRDGWRAEWAV